nr:hypothetical protein CFP56_36144 [Quercus suber]
MAAGFLDLPCEIRNMIYELVLLHEDPIELWRLEPRRRQQFDIEILRVNKTIYREASPMFYGQNRFELREYNHSLIESLLLLIGTPNARLIQHVVVDLKSVLDLKPFASSYRLVHNYFCADLFACCPKLRSLNALPPGIAAIDQLLTCPDDSQAVRNVLSRIKTKMGLCQSLDRLVAEFPTLHLLCQGKPLSQELERAGWTIKPVPCGGRDHHDRLFFESDFVQTVGLILYRG